MSEQLVKRLRELSNAVTRADWNEFSMRIPVEKDRDADFVLLQAADKFEALEADAARMDWIEKNARTDPKMDGNHVFWPTTLNKALRGANLRAAIDDAMKGGA